MRKALQKASCRRLHFPGLYIHASLHDARKHVSGEFFRSAWKFGVVRNPWARLWSRYCCLRMMCQRWERDHPIGEHGMIYAAHGVTFREWLLRLGEPRFCIHSLDLRPQAELVEGADFVGRFEDMSGTLTTISKKLHKNLEMPHANQAKRPKSGEHVYDPEMREFVRRMYSRDLEVFGYEYDESVIRRR